jgi:hypothetical protein
MDVYIHYNQGNPKVWIADYSTRTVIWGSLYKKWQSKQVVNDVRATAYRKQNDGYELIATVVKKEAVDEMQAFLFSYANKAALIVPTTMAGYTLVNMLSNWLKNKNLHHWTIPVPVAEESPSASQQSAANEGKSAANKEKQAIVSRKISDSAWAW